jgi:hypothetical protein
LFARAQRKIFFTRHAAQITRAMMLSWWRKRGATRAALRSRRSGSRLIERYNGKYDDAESQTSIELRRLRADGRKVSARTIRAAMRRHMHDKHPNEVDSFKASNSWLRAFVRRFGFAWRRATNRKAKTVDDRLPAVRRYIARLARRLARHAPPTAVNAGADAPPPMGIAATLRLNVDQTPFNLDIDGRYTYSDSGATGVQVAAGHGQHRDSRFGTLQVMIDLGGETRLQPKVFVLVFVSIDFFFLF